MATATRTAAVATRARGGAATRPSTRPAPRPVETKRPDLQLVAQSRRERRRLIGFIVAAGILVALFLIVCAQTLIISQQGHIDSVNRSIASAQSHAEQLRLELAQLQSPQRITSEATSRLGMIPAPTPMYLQPRSTDEQRAAEIPPAPVPTTAAKAKVVTSTPAAPSGTTR